MWPKVSGGFGSKIDAGKVEDLKKQITQGDGSVIPAFIPEARAYVLPFDSSEAGASQFSDGSTIADGLVVSNVHVMVQNIIWLVNIMQVQLLEILIDL